ncbi:MAG: 2Fe-2S iron-sulfur cluster-binding protein [Rhodospirillaceae bacterium]
MTKVVFVEKNGARKEISTDSKTTLLHIAQANDIDMEGACEGSMACSTCHVIVSNEWYAKLPQPSEAEADMLDLTYGVSRTSRLACQIVVTDALDGLTVLLPQSTRNMME